MKQYRFLDFLWIAPLVAFMAIGTGQLYAQDKDSHGSGDHQGHSHGMSDAEMQKMMALSQPGEYHQRMNKMVGDWKTKITMWMGPGEPTVTEGTARSEWMLGSRYLQTKHTSSFNGMPFEGVGIDGFDNAKGEYFSLWFDNMGTGFMTTTAKPSTDGKTLTYKGTSFDPSQGKEVTVRQEVEWTGERTYTFSMYMGSGGQEMKVMELSAEKQ